MTFSVEHEWDEGGNCAIGVSKDIPCWKFSLWDVAGIAFGTLGGMLMSVGTGLGYLNRECQAAAQYSRTRYDEAREAFEQEQARAEMAGALEGIVMFGDPLDEDLQ